METGADSAGLINTNDSCLAMEMTAVPDDHDSMLVATKQSGKPLMARYNYRVVRHMSMKLCSHLHRSV